jgi:hypothetical protein
MEAWITSFISVAQNSLRGTKKSTISPVVVNEFNSQAK